MASWIQKLVSWLTGTKSGSPAAPERSLTGGPAIMTPAGQQDRPTSTSAAPTEPGAVKVEQDIQVRYQESSSLAPEAPVTSKPISEAVADLHIGLDLGTSCSKLAIGDSFLDQYYGVDFTNSAEGVAKYLFPTRFYEGTLGATLLTQPGAAARSDLKLRLMEAVERHADTTETESDLAIYLALLLNHAFSWFERHHARDHRTRRCCWWLNVGFPAKRVENNPKLSAAYKRCCRAAIRAVESGEPISRILVQRFVGPDRPAGNGFARLADDRINLYPEIAAQLAGYAYSPYRRNDPLLLVDIGAGTLDVSTLILHRREGEEVCSFHFCEVAPLGVFHLYRETHRAMRLAAPNSLKFLAAAADDLAWRIPTSPGAYLDPGAALTSALQKAFHDAQNSFATKCLDTCHSNFALFKAYLDEPAVSQNQRPRAFRERVNFILSGGGSRSRFYLRLFPDALEQRLLNLTSWPPETHQRRAIGQGLNRIHFMQPEKFRAEGVGAEDFDRMSVAHGLSMGAETLMKITAKEASDRQWAAT
jgi:hypothetical protein